MAYVIGNASLWAYSAEGAGDLYFGTVQEESATSTCDLMEFLFSGEDSSGTDVDDMGGVAFHLTVTIEKTSTSAANMATFLTALTGLHNGQQDRDQGYPFTYQSTLFGSKLVKIQRIDILSVSTSQLICRYNITFWESAA